MPPERLPIEGLDSLDLHAAHERLRLAKATLRKAQREADMAQEAVHAQESKMGLKVSR